MNKDISVDVAIIGAGTAGISAFKEASKVTDKIVLIDKGPLGTTCARAGCMPSKTLIQIADDFHYRHQFSKLGIVTDKIHIDMPKAMEQVRKLRDYFTSGIIKYIHSLGERFIEGNAEFCGPQAMMVNQQKIIAKRIIIATGTASIVPDEWQISSNKILTSENIFEQCSFQKKIAVVGGGAIGIELAQALSRLGIEIELFHSHGFIAELTDPIVNAYAINCLTKEFPIHLGDQAMVAANNKSILVTHREHAFSAENIIAAVGRRPNLAALKLDRLGIKRESGGLPLYDHSTLQITHMPIYLAGDVRKFHPLLHEAADDGTISGYNAVREKPRRFMRRTPLMIIFSQPNIAMVGKSFQALQGTDFICGEVCFEDQGRARIMSQNKGILRIYAERKNGKLLGAEMIAPSGEHLAHLLSHAIQQNLTVYDVLRMPFYHPVLEEGMRTALRAIATQVSHQSEDDHLELVSFAHAPRSIL